MPFAEQIARQHMVHLLERRYGISDCHTFRNPQNQY